MRLGLWKVAWQPYSAQASVIACSVENSSEGSANPMLPTVSLRPKRLASSPMRDANILSRALKLSFIVYTAPPRFNFWYDFRYG